jgi:hypothetical protein
MGFFKPAGDAEGSDDPAAEGSGLDSEDDGAVTGSAAEDGQAASEADAGAGAPSVPDA